MDLEKKRQVEFQKIYDETYGNSYALAMSMMDKNKEDALDVLQESYIKIFNNVDKVRDTSKIKSWVCKIVANTCRDWQRKRKNVVFSDIDGDEDDGNFEETLENDHKEFDPEESVDYSETKRLMSDILDSLPESQKMCILLHYYEELNVTEIAELLECSEGTVKSRLNYARKKIKIEVEELERKGTKLYSAAPLPFIVWMLKDAETSHACEISKNIVLEGVQDSVGQVLGETVNISQEAASKVTDGTTNNVGNMGKGASKNAGMLASKKLIIGIVVLSLAIGGVVGIPKLMNKSTNSTANVKQEVKEYTKQDILDAYSQYFKENKNQIIRSFTDYDDTGHGVWEMDLCMHIMDTNGDKVPEYIYYSPSGNGGYAQQINDRKFSHLITFLNGEIVDVPWEYMLMATPTLGPTMDFYVSKDGSKMAIINDDFKQQGGYQIRMDIEKTDKGFVELKEEIPQEELDTYKKYSWENCNMYSATGSDISEFRGQRISQFYSDLATYGIEISKKPKKETKEAKAYKIYQSFLETYKNKLIEAAEGDGFVDIIDEDLMPLRIDEDSLGYMGYQFKDTNGDGIDELFIGEGSEIKDIYYFYNGEIHSLRSEKAGKNEVFTLREKCIQYSHELVPITTTEFIKFDKSGNFCIEQAVSSHQPLNEYAAPMPGERQYTYLTGWTSHDFDTQEELTYKDITEEDYLAIEESYGEPVQIDFINFDQLETEIAKATGKNTTEPELVLNEADLYDIETGLDFTKMPKKLKQDLSNSMDNEKLFKSKVKKHMEGEGIDLKSIEIVSYYSLPDTGDGKYYVLELYSPEKREIIDIRWTKTDLSDLECSFYK